MHRSRVSSPLQNVSIEIWFHVCVQLAVCVAGTGVGFHLLHCSAVNKFTVRRGEWRGRGLGATKVSHLQA